MSERSLSYLMAEAARRRRVVPLAALTGSLTREQSGWLGRHDGILEARATRPGDLGGELRRGFDGPLLFSLRDSGGEVLRDPERARLLGQAARDFDLVELDAGRDLRAEVLEAIPAARRVIRCGEAAPAGAGPGEQLERATRTPAALYRLVVAADEAPDELPALELLSALGRRDVCVEVRGRGGGWSRPLLAMVGAPIVCGPIGDGDPSLVRTMADFGLPALPAPTCLYGIVGRSVGHSLSPRLHNAGYRASGLAALYLPFRVDDFQRFLDRLGASEALARLGMPIRGLTVIAPHTEAACRIADEHDPGIRHVGAANLLVRAGNGWRAGSTDAEGVLEPLREIGLAVAGLPAAVVGCGGAGRAVAAGLAAAGAEVTIVNRTEERGRRTAERLGRPFLPLGELRPEAFRLLVNATPTGRNGSPSAVDLDAADGLETVVDLVYGDHPTPLIRRARQLGLQAIDGRRVLVAQARAQMLGMTGFRMSRQLALDLVEGKEPAIESTDLPAASLEAAAAAEARLIVPIYHRAPLVFTHGRGSSLFAGDGRQYLDFAAGIAVNALGHGDPELLEAIHRQADRLIHVSNMYYSEPQLRLAAALVERSFADRVFFCNSGGEANDAAVKFARKWARVELGVEPEAPCPKHDVIAFDGCFHGRTIGSVSFTGTAAYRREFEPLMGGVTFVPFNDLEAVGRAIGPQTCCVILETIKGQGGLVPADAEFLRGLRALCDRHRALLILDEVQCGLGRTGKLWAYEAAGIEPDVMTLAKGLAGGLPMGATLVREEVATALAPGDHGCTFAGGPLVCAAAEVVLERVSKPEFLRQVADKGRHLRRRLRELRSERVVDIRGAGLFVGVELDRPVAAVIGAARRRGLLLLGAGPRVLRLCPPLVTTIDEIDQAMDVLGLCLEELE